MELNHYSLGSTLWLASLSQSDNLRPMKLWFPLLALLALVGCQTSPTPDAPRAADSLTPEQVIASAKLDQTLANPRQLTVAQADGRAALGEYVTLLNGAEAKRFLRKHGYAKTLRTLDVRRTPSTIQVDVEIEGKDGAKATLTLYADGAKQGQG